MGNDTYTSVPLDDDGPYAPEKRQRSPRLEKAMRWAFISLFTVVVFLLGFAAGDRYGQTVKAAVSIGGPEAVAEGGESGNNATLLSPQAFVPDCELNTWAQIAAAGWVREVRELTRLMAVPMKGVKFDFPTEYEDTSVEGDKLWDKLMPSK